MDHDDFHPVAREVLAAFAVHDYFRSNKFCRTIADVDPRRCVTWAFRLASPCVLAGSPPPIVAQTVSLVESAVDRCDVKDLAELDVAASDTWSAGSFDDSSPHLQRAAARLAWATICFISHTTGADFETKFSGVSNAARDHTAFTEMVNQSAMAIDMTIGKSNDGRLLIASSFSKEMEVLSGVQRPPTT